MHAAFLFGFGTGMSQLQRTFNEATGSDDVIAKVIALHRECESILAMDLN